MPNRGRWHSLLLLSITLTQAGKNQPGVKLVRFTARRRGQLQTRRKRAGGYEHEIYTVPRPLHFGHGPFCPVNGCWTTFIPLHIGQGRPIVEGLVVGKTGERVAGVFGKRAWMAQSGHSKTRRCPLQTGQVFIKDFGLDERPVPLQLAQTNSSSGFPHLVQIFFSDGMSPSAAFSMIRRLYNLYLSKSFLF